LSALVTSVSQASSRLKHRQRVLRRCRGGRCRSFDRRGKLLQVQSHEQEVANDHGSARHTGGDRPHERGLWLAVAERAVKPTFARVPRSVLKLASPRRCSRLPLSKSLQTRAEDGRRASGVRPSRSNPAFATGAGYTDLNSRRPSLLSAAFPPNAPDVLARYWWKHETRCVQRVSEWAVLGSNQ